MLICHAYVNVLPESSWDWHGVPVDFPTSSGAMATPGSLHGFDDSGSFMEAMAQSKYWLMVFNMFFPFSWNVIIPIDDFYFSDG